MPSVRAKVSKTSGQGLTRGAYKTGYKLGMRTDMGGSGLKQPKKAKKAKVNDAVKRSNRAAEKLLAEPIFELNKLGGDD
jgi:hypothetical protein